LGKEGGTYAVPEPVRCGGKTNTTGSDGERKDLADGDPGDRTPGGGEHADVYANKCNHGRCGGFVVRLGAVGLTGCDADDANDVLGDDHTGSAEDEKVAATHTLN